MADASRAAPAPTTPPQAIDVLLDGLVLQFISGFGASQINALAMLFLEMSSNVSSVNAIFFGSSTSLPAPASWQSAVQPRL